MHACTHTLSRKHAHKHTSHALKTKHTRMYRFMSLTDKSVLNDQPELFIR